VDRVSGIDGRKHADHASGQKLQHEGVVEDVVATETTTSGGYAHVRKVTRPPSLVVSVMLRYVNG
jgi:hypothetical protein